MVQCDNTKCRTAVRSFKFKFFSKITCKHSQTGEPVQSRKQLFGFKEPGTKAQQSSKRVFVLDVPTSLESQPIPGSWLGDLFKIEFELMVCVKHDAWNATGQGDSVLIPIKVLASPQLVQSEENFRVPQNYRPRVMIP
jgi:hypothetical protein